jgi:hypothetical protein
MTGGNALKGLAALAAVLVAAVALGAVAGFGPLARAAPAAEVDDPREMLARGLQAVLDSTAVHLEGTVEGTLPGALLDRAGEPVRLDGTTLSADALPKDARTRAHVEIPALDVALDTTSEWDALWYRTAPEEPWLRATVGGLAAEAGVDVNPLTLVDRLRSYLARPDIEPSVTDAACPNLPGPCRRIVVDAGNDPVALLGVMLPEATRAALPEVSTRVTVEAEVATLRPDRVVVEMASADGSLDLRLVLTASRWDDPSIVIEAPSPGS